MNRNSFRILKKSLGNICLPQNNGFLGLHNGQSGQASLVMIFLVKTLQLADGDGEDCCGDHGVVNHDGDDGAHGDGDDDDGGRGDEDRGDDVSRRCGSRST